MNITAPILGTDHIIGVMGSTDPVTLLTLATAPTQAPSLSRLAIDPIILAALVIMSVGPTTSGGRVIGHGATVEGSGSTATTL
jgi:hypothetical protein